ncbi:MAG TPA: glycosyltransferase family 4 protein [Phycisphaerae bacterium]|nr:glycosyltransferase family 4 protein [Phycisphaerae bacterium]HNU46244.1 glycosyltransferase family 4 protein [Phycisphaerae bacterium]
MATTTTTRDPLTVSAVLCVDTEGLDRLGAALRYLAIGLVDQAVQVRLLSADARVGGLMLGPIQTLVHEPLVWPLARRRLRYISDVLAAQPPTVVHALCGGSYALAGALAAEFDADLLLSVSSPADARRLTTMDRKPVQRFLVATAPLLELLEAQVGIAHDALELVRPGILARKEVACFAEPGRAPTILCPAGFHRGSGVDRLIAAVGLLRRRDPQRRVLLFLPGEGPREPALRRQVDQCGIKPYVTFVHPLDDLAAALRSADVFVEPAGTSGFAITPLQAMAAGLAVVTGPNDACDLFHDGRTALVCPDPDPEALADTIGRLLADPAFSRELGAAAQEYVRTHHATSAMAERTAALYRELALARATFRLADAATGT